MRWTLFLNLSKYKIAVFVVIVHLFPFFFITGKMKNTPIPLAKTPLVVHTYVNTPKEVKTQEPSIKQVSKAPIKPKPLIQAQKKSPPKTKVIPKKTKKQSQAAVQEVEKIFSNIKNMKTTPSSYQIDALDTPSTLALSSKALSSGDKNSDALFDYLQTMIELPKKGSIKLSFSMDPKGKIINIQVEDDGIDRDNALYIKELLATLSLPKEIVGSYKPFEVIHLTLCGVIVQ